MSDEGFLEKLKSYLNEKLKKQYKIEAHPDQYQTAMDGARLKWYVNLNWIYCARAEEDVKRRV